MMGKNVVVFFRLYRMRTIYMCVCVCGSQPHYKYANCVVNDVVMSNDQSDQFLLEL